MNNIRVIIKVQAVARRFLAKRTVGRIRAQMLLREAMQSTNAGTFSQMGGYTSTVVTETLQKVGTYVYGD